MDEAGAPQLLHDAVVYLAAAVILIPIFASARLGAILGYLFAGILIGPHVFALISDPDKVLSFSEMGIVMLLFVVGLDLAPRRLWALRRDIFGLGTLQIVVCGLAMAAFLIVVGFSWQAALVVGLALALSSTALIVQHLQSKGQVATPIGTRTISVLLQQDIAIVPLLLVTAALARTPHLAETRTGVTLVLVTLAAIAGLVVAARLFLNPLFRLIAKTGAREVFAIGALLTVLGASFLMASLGVSMALGAFIAGVMLADSPYRHEVAADIEPFRGLLLGLFFMAVGMTLDVRVLLHFPFRILEYVLVLMALKLVLVTGLARMFGSSFPDALRIGAFLAQGGEFAFVILSRAEAGVLIAPEALAIFATVVTISMVLTPLLVRSVGRVATRLERRGADEAPLPAGPDGKESGSVIVVGHGRFGQILSQLLTMRGLNVTLIDEKPSEIARSAGAGWKVFYGNGLRPEVLRAAGAEDARLLVVAVNGRWSPEPLTDIRANFPHLAIAARAYDRLHQADLMRHDAGITVFDLLPGGVALGRMVLKALGTDDAAIDSVVSEFRQWDSDRLNQLLVGSEKVAR